VKNGCLFFVASDFLVNTAALTFIFFFDPFMLHDNISYAYCGQCGLDPIRMWNVQLKIISLQYDRLIIENVRYESKKHTRFYYWQDIIQRCIECRPLDNNLVTQFVMDIIPSSVCRHSAVQDFVNCIWWRSLSVFLHNLKCSTATRWILSLKTTVW
jgi:hypothetical protein